MSRNALILVTENDEVFTNNSVIILTPRSDCHLIEKPCRTWTIASEDKINFSDERRAKIAVTNRDCAGGETLAKVISR